MSLLNEQACFLADMWRLASFLRELRLTVTGGEFERTKEQQEIYVKTGKSKTMNSMHLKKCAMDLNIFHKPNGKFVLITDKELWKKIGAYWKSLDTKNRWGGDFKDLYDTRHFERYV